MKGTELLNLKASCETLLDEYVIEARRTCEALSKMEPPPLQLDERIELHGQRLRENDALARYQAARASVFRALNIA